MYLGAEPGGDAVAVSLYVSPEPGTLTLLGAAAIGGLVFLRRRLFGLIPRSEGLPRL
jgi:hypothetical protein